MFCLILQNKEPDFAHINKNWLRPLKGIRTFFKHALESILKCAEWRFIMKRGWLLLIVLLCVAFLISCGKKTEPDETKGELVKIEREADPGRASLFLFFCSYFEKKKIFVKCTKKA